MTGWMVFPFRSLILLKHSATRIARQRQRDGFDDEYVRLLKAMIDLHPAKALRLLRETRPRKIRRDLDEVDATRRELLADCFTALNRPALAAALRK
ncbi:MAG TPA: hypothetical protein PLY87_17210 [Planctomycetaceae bacterium]|nr:hypothetical protein [Planctomycetaceae bacterium]